MVNFLIGSMNFKTKSIAQKYVREKIYSMELGKKIKGTADFNFLLELLNNHHDKINKIGSGVEHFILYEKVIGTARHIKINDSDIHFSWNECAGRAQKKDKITEAFRNAITKQITEFHNNSILRCSKCSDVFIEVEVHHDKTPFYQLKQNFLEQYSKEIPSTFAKDSGGKTIFRPEEHYFEMKWRRYHRKHACLVLLCKECHDKTNL